MACGTQRTGGEAEHSPRLHHDRGGADSELDGLDFGQGLESLCLNRGVVHEAVLLAVLGRDETEPLRVVEPLHGTGDTCHLMKLLFTNCSRRRASSPCGAPRPVIPAPVSEATPKKSRTGDVAPGPRNRSLACRSAEQSIEGQEKSSITAQPNPPAARAARTHAAPSGRDRTRPNTHRRACSSAAGGSLGAFALSVPGLHPAPMATRPH